MMRILVCGGREYDDWAELDTTLRSLLGARGDMYIIQGGAKGADFLARVWAEYVGVDWTEYPADWKQFGKRAGHIRNAQMLTEGEPDLVIAFRGGRGTADMVNKATSAGIEVKEIT